MWICITVRFPCNQELAFSESQLKAIIGNVHVISSLNYRIIVTSKCNSQRVNCSRFYPFKYPKAGNWKITQTINKTFMLIFMETAGQNTVTLFQARLMLFIYMTYVHIGFNVFG